jgi:hypothetical protein
MPRRDGTGPLSMGSMTGRRVGYCAGFDMPGYANAAPGNGFGRGRGCRGLSFGAGGRGWMRFGVYGIQPVQTDPAGEREALRSRADMLQSELESIKKRLNEIDATTPSQ